MLTKYVFCRDLYAVYPDKEYYEIEQLTETDKEYLEENEPFYFWKECDGAFFSFEEEIWFVCFKGLGVVFDKVCWDECPGLFFEKEVKRLKEFFDTTSFDEEDIQFTVDHFKDKKTITFSDLISWLENKEYLTAEEESWLKEEVV